MGSIGSIKGALELVPHLVLFIEAAAVFFDSDYVFLRDEEFQDSDMVNAALRKLIEEKKVESAKAELAKAS